MKTIPISFTALVTICLCITPSFLSAQEAPDTPPAPVEAEEEQEFTPELLQKLVDDLSSDDFDTREASQYQLWKAGKSAEGLLAGLIAADEENEPGAEAGMRMRRVLAEFSYGIYPDTPEETISLIRQFRSGDIDERQMSIARLTELGDFALIFKLMNTVKDRDQREMLSRVVARHTEDLVRTRILEEKYDDAERILRISAVVPDAMRNYAAFCHLRGRTDAAAKGLESENLPDEVRVEMLHWLARVSGNYDTALKLAEELEDESLIRETRVLQGDVGAYCRGAVDFNTRTIRVLAHKAALARHAGDTTAFSDHIEDILKYSTEFPEEAESVYEALVANGRADEALDVVRKNSPLTAFNHLIRQERYEEALAVLGIDTLMPPYTSWLSETCKEITNAEDSTDAYGAILEIYNVARFLSIRGLKKEATEIMQEAANSLEDYHSALSTNMCNIYRFLDMRELLFAHAEKSLAMGIDFEDVITDVFRGYNDTAMHLSLRFPEEMKDKQGAVIRKIAALLIPEGDTPSDESKKFLADLEDFVKKEDAKKKAEADPNKDEDEEKPNARDLNRRRLFNRALNDPFAASKDRDWHRTLAEVYVALDLYDDARRHYALCDDAEINGSTHLNVADYAAMQKKWKLASEYYNKAWEEDDSSELYLYLSGWALYREGAESKAEGENLMEKARLLMLASPNRNSEVARMLWDQGDADLAEPIARLVLNVSAPSDSESIRQAEYLSQHLRYTDKEKEAARLQERVLLYMVSRKSGSTALVSRSWVEVLEARAALRAGDKKAAMEAIDRALKLTPGDSSAVEDFHPMLIERGFEQEANALFDRAYPISKKATELFPEYDQGNNNHAWLLARCKRNLDEALTHAKKALEIDPDSAATTDTLAEVYYAKGDFAKAVEVSDKALEIMPTDAQLQKQNKRFRAALEKAGGE